MVVVAWVGSVSSAIFYILNRLHLFRVDKAIELLGLDIAEMGALSEEVYKHIRLDALASQSHLIKRHESVDPNSDPAKSSVAPVEVGPGDATPLENR